MTPIPSSAPAFTLPRDTRRPILAHSIASRLRGPWAAACLGLATLAAGALPAGAQTFSSLTAITIPNGAPGTTQGVSNPYPSSIVVSGTSGTISNVTVSLTNFSHTFPDDLDLLLVAPGGQNVVLMSDTGGTNDLVGVNLTFSDAAATSLPDSTQIVSGTFKPTNIGAGDTFPASAPAGPYGTTLAVFNGTGANGTWSLFVFDDLAGDVGSIAGGYSITLTMALPAPTSGPLLQNSAPVGVLTTADFIVNGEVNTGGAAESNTVNSLTFLPGSSLTVHNTLSVTNGLVDVVGNSAIKLDGTLSASQLNILASGLLGGNGAVGGNLLNSGTVSPGNSPGVINVSGNYTQTSTGTLRIEVGGRATNQFDQMLVGGQARLAGTLELVRLNGFNLKRGDRIEFLTATQGVDGEFTTVVNPFISDTILEPTVVYADTSVALEMVQGSFEKYASRAGLTPNQRAVAGALDSVAFDPREEKMIAYLNDQNLNSLPGDFDRIAPEELTSIFTISTSLATVQSVNLQRRTDDIRAGSTGFSAAGLAMQGTGPGYSGHLAGAAGPSGKESKAVKTVVPEEQRWGAFLTGVGEWIEVGTTGNAAGYDITTGGFTLGLDYKVCSNFAVGISAGYAGTGADLTGGGSVLVNGGQLGLYATTFVGGWYADLAVAGGLNSYDTKRSALQGTARGSTEGGELNALFGTGYDWKVGALTIGPTATFNYTLVGVDRFTERGSLAPLEIANRNAESMRTALGFKASYDWKVAGMIVKPELRVAWQHEFGDSSYALDASFANGGGNDFLVNGPQLGRDSLLLGLGFAVQCSERCSTYLYYDGELGRKEFDRHAISGGLRISF